MAAPQPQPQIPAALHSAAEGNLRFIRATMASGGAFTSVSGPATVFAGVIACVAGVLSLSVSSLASRWPALWLAVAAVAGPVGILMMMRKAARNGSSMTHGVGRRFLFALVPGFLACALLSLAMLVSGQLTLVPATWLLGYGASVCAAGALSVRAVRALGMLCMACGAACVALDPAQQQWCLIAGFGAAHILVGAYIWRRHGG
ncbi:MAG: hypothetical protein AAGA68_09830 [Pseudomonadota bacterium]